MTGTLVLLAIVLYRAIGAQRAMWTVFVLATSGLAIAAAKMCLTDAVLLLFVTTAQVCLYALWRGDRSWGTFISMGIAIGLAGLTKGPVVLGVMGTTLVVLWILNRITPSRSAKPPSGKGSAIKLVVALLIVAGICAPWLILIHQREPDFLPTILGHDVVERMRSGLEGHKGPPGYYLLLIWVTYFPWSLLLPATIIHAWRRRHLPPIRFALAGIIGPWILFEIVQTKLPHYILPTFPFLAFLTADMLVRAGRKLHHHISSKGFVKIVAIWSAIVIAASLVPWASLKMFRPYINGIAIASVVILTVLAVVYAVAIYHAFRRGRPLGAATIMGIGMLLIVLVMYVGYFPNAAFLKTSQRVANALREAGATNAIMIDYKEDSLPWCEGGTIRPQRDDDFLLHHPPDSWPRFIVLTGEVWRKTPFEIQRQFDVLDMVRGWDYSDHLPTTPGPGRVVDVFVLRKK
jgi:4-amino-4-deoxy-L-arabinose transferase-like glycosyltransferase